MKTSLTRRVSMAVAAAAMGAATLMASGVAQANPGNYVAFGDSFPANPGQSSPTVQGENGCPQAENNIARLAGKKMGLDVRDFTCTGTVVHVPSPKNLMNYINDAIAKGALNGDTKLVTVFAGANDAMQTVWAPAQLQNDWFQTSMTEAINKIKQHAPNARVISVGYPEFTSRDDAHFMCPINVNGFAPHVPAAPVYPLEMAVQARQIRAAETTGTEFLNMKDVSNINVAMCGVDGERQVSAFLDSDTSQYNMTNHLTHRGSEVFAQEIANKYRG